MKKIKIDGFEDNCDICGKALKGNTENRVRSYIKQHKDAKHTPKPGVIEPR